MNKFYYPQVKAIDADQGIYEAMITTEVVDRDDEIMLVDGARLDNYLKNPIVLFGHNYTTAEAVVGRTLEINKISNKGIRARFQFADEVSEQAALVKRLWAGGFLNAVSIGFVPYQHEYRDIDGKNVRVYTDWELLEFSIVPVPANQEALRMALKALEEKRAEKRAVPYADHGISYDDWDAPALGDFTDESMEALDDDEKMRIAAHFAWSANLPPMKYEDLKLPHHAATRRGVGKAVWRGVTAAMAALFGARGGVNIPQNDIPDVYDHLAKHYRQFGQEPPVLESVNYEYGKHDAPIAEPNVTASENDVSDEMVGRLIDVLSRFIQTISEVINE